MKDTDTTRDPAPQATPRDSSDTSVSQTTGFTPTDGLSVAYGELPEKIGRYRIERLLGSGGFGRVYLARDEELQRAVAIKVPRPERFYQLGAAEPYLAEARTLASLHHPGIVPVYDAGIGEDGLPFIVSKYVEGGDLAQRTKENPLPISVAAALVSNVADALHYAHGRGIFHRDVKPSNILLDNDQQPLLGDFGLALRDDELGKGDGFAGTPAFMSPEQARGRGDQIDGRADIFSLGIVLYELLTGRRPFRGDSVHEVLDQITHGDVRPPRQINDAIPPELERICLKALEKHPADRYSTAKDLSNDLSNFVASLHDSATLCTVGRQGTASLPDSRQAKLQSGLHFGKLGCSVQVAISLVVLLTISLSLVSHPAVWRQISPLVTVHSLPASNERPEKDLQELLEKQDFDAAERYLEKLKQESPGEYGSTAVQHVRAEVQRQKLFNQARLAKRLRAVEEVRAALAKDDWQQLKQVREQITVVDSESLFPMEITESQQLGDALVAAINRHQAQRDQEFKQQFAALTEEAAKIPEQDFDKLAALNDRVRKLQALEDVSEQTRAQVEIELTKLAGTVGQAKRFALRELLAVDRINRSVGNLSEYEAALENYVTTFPEQPRSAAFRIALQHEMRSGRSVEHWNKALTTLQSIKFAEVSPDQAQQLLLDLRFLRSVFADQQPPELVAWQPYVYATLNRARALLSLETYFADRSIFDLQAVIQANGTRYYFDGDPRTSRTKPDELEFLTVTDLLQNKTRIVSIPSADIRNPQAPQGEFVWASPQQRFRDLVVRRLRPMLDQKQGTQGWDEFWTRELDFLFRETQMEPVLQLEIAQRLLQTGAEGSYPFSLAYGDCRQEVLKDPWVKEQNWIDPRDEDGGRRRRAAVVVLTRLKERLPAAAAALSAAAVPRFEARTTSRYAIVGWLRKDTTGKWIASVPKLKAVASHDLYVMHSNAAGALIPTRIGDYSDGVVTFEDDADKLFREGMLVYAVERI